LDKVLSIMAIKLKSDRYEKHSIDIDGPGGNAFFILGRAKGYAEQLGYDSKAVLDKMQSADYIDLLIVFETFFGSVCDIKTDNKDLISSIYKRKEELYDGDHDV